MIHCNRCWSTVSEQGYDHSRQWCAACCQAPAPRRWLLKRPKPVKASKPRKQKAPRGSQKPAKTFYVPPTTQESWEAEEALERLYGPNMECPF